MRKSASQVGGGRVLRAAIIGCGLIAGLHDARQRDRAVRSHAKAYWLEPSTRLVAVADRDPDRAREFAARWKVPGVYGSVRALMEEESPDLVSICTPDETHLDVFQECLGSRRLKAVWCEKPLAIDPVAGEVLVAACKKRGIVLAVNYQRRWDRLAQWAGGIIRKGELGAIQKVVVYYTKGILHNGSHAVDLLLDWFGAARDLRTLGTHNDFATHDPTVDARLICGEVPVYLVGLNARHYGVFELQVHGTEGRLNMENFGREVRWYARDSGSGPGETRELNPRPRARRRETPRAMGEALHNIVRAVATGEAVRSDGETALETLRVCHQLAVGAGRLPIGGA